MLSIIALALLAAPAFASPIAKRLQSCTVNPANTSPPPQCNSADPAYTQSEASLYANINCNAVAGGITAVKKPYLLVPGTGNGGADSFDNGGYLQLIPPLGYDVCYLVEPRHMDNDAQNTDEQIAYAINTLSTIANNQTIVHGWSQGNLDIQWVLVFWASALSNTNRFISTAGDFRGTTVVAFANALQNALTTGQLRARDLEHVKELEKRQNSGLGTLALVPLPPSVRQQLTGSNYLNALAKHGGLSGKVPTTSIYSSSDDIVSPEDNTPTASSYLSGSNVGNILIQNFCPGLRYSHADQLNLNFTYQVVKAALGSSTGYASPAQVSALAIPCNTNAAPGANPQKSNQALTVAATYIIADSNPLVGGTLVEPPVRAYAR